MKGFHMGIPSLFHLKMFVTRLFKIDHENTKLGGLYNFHDFVMQKCLLSNFPGNSL